MCKNKSVCTTGSCMRPIQCHSHSEECVFRMLIDVIWKVKTNYVFFIPLNPSSLIFHCVVKCTYFLCVNWCWTIIGDFSSTRLRQSDNTLSNILVSHSVITLGHPSSLRSAQFDQPSKPAEHGPLFHWVSIRSPVNLAFPLIQWEACVTLLQGLVDHNMNVSDRLSHATPAYFKDSVS